MTRNGEFRGVPTAATARTDLGVRPGQHPGVQRYLEARTHDSHARVADVITAFAGSMPFVYVHVAAFATWMLLMESSPWPALTLVVSLEAIFLSTFVLIGQNRQAEVAKAAADHDFVEQELELKTNTQLTREVHARMMALEERLAGMSSAPGSHSRTSLTAMSTAAPRSDRTETGTGDLP